MTVMTRRALALGATAALAAPARARSQSPFAQALERGERLPQLQAMIIARGGEEQAARVYSGPSLDTPVNIKSASKSVLSALVGIAVRRGVIESVDVPVVDLLGDRAPADLAEEKRAITVEDLLTMRAGLASTSGSGYGPWVVSDDWTAYALDQPMVARPGTEMIYSTGSSHLLAAALTEASGRSLLTLARDWLGEPLGISVPAWTRAPEGVYMGGNNMALSARALLAFGELYRNGGTVGGDRVLTEEWITRTWTPRVRSPWSGEYYGYGWWVDRVRRRDVYFAWGYGGQMVYVIPTLSMTVVMTSDATARGVDGHVQALHRLLAGEIIAEAAG